MVESNEMKLFFTNLNNNSNNNNNFQNALYDAFNYQTIEKNPERISKLKPYINKYNWEEIDFTEKPKEWIKFEKIITQLH